MPITVVSKLISKYSIMYNTYREKMAKISGALSQTMLSKENNRAAFRLVTTT